MLLSLPITNPILIFAIILFIILVCPLLLEKVNIPGIIGLIICGIIIGPNGFNILANDSAIKLFSTIGLLYLMFLIGIELDLNEFRLNKYRSILFGSLTFIIPLSIGFCVCYYLLHYNFNASLLIASTFSTHTLVTYSIVTKRNITKDKSVSITIGGTIITDIAVLILLAIIVNKVQSGISTQFWIKLVISLIVFILAIFLLIPILSKWFFKKFEGESQSHYIYVLLILILSSLFAELIGLEPIIGAFMSGIAINRFIPKSSQLMNKIEFVGNSLFVPFFLISVGMLVNVKIIFQNYNILLLSILFTIICITGKWLAAFITQLVCGFNKSQRNLMSGLSTAHTAGSLAIILAGQRIGLINNNILNATVIFILLTCIAASFITQSASKQIAISHDFNIKHDFLPIIPEEHFLVPYFNLHTFSKQLDFITLIKNKKSNMPVSILYVIPNDENAEEKISSIKSSTNMVQSLSADAELNIDECFAIDNNTVSAIIRTSREKSTYPIIIPWGETNPLANIYEERIRNIVQSVDKSVYICHLEDQLVYNKRITLLTPQLCELEIGFPLWLSKVQQLSQELSIPIHVFGANNTYKSIINVLNNGNKVNYIIFHLFNDWNNYSSLEKQINKDDIIIMIMSRKGYLSSNIHFDYLPFKIEKSFKNQTMMAIFPYQSIIPNENTILKI